MRLMKNIVDFVRSDISTNRGSVPTRAQEREVPRREWFRVCKQLSMSLTDVHVFWYTGFPVHLFEIYAGISWSTDVQRYTVDDLAMVWQE
jgi:hypothetical protein